MINVSGVKMYCRDDFTKIENYDKAVADKDRSWVCHHRLELTLNNDFALTPEDLKRHNMYYNRPYYELIFLTRQEHTKLHSEHRGEAELKHISEHNKGKVFSKHTRALLSKALKGNLNGATKAKRKAKLYKEYKANGGTLLWNEFQKLK